MERCTKLNSELPDSVISYIFSKFSMKDLVKTSALSKRWLHEWGFRTNLNFDLQNMFSLDYNTIQELPKNLPLFRGIQSQFATILDQFMLHYPGVMIHSIRVNFPLRKEHGYVINKLISKGIAKGVERIELLFSFKTKYSTEINLQIDPYKFFLTLLSDTNSLTYLHLENCIIVAPISYSGLNNLRTLVLHLVDVDQYLFQGLSNCIHLVDFTLDACKFNFDLKIISPTLLHLNIVNCENESKNIDIIASNLLSFEYSSIGDNVHPMNIKAHMLSKFRYRGSSISEPSVFSGLKNVTTIMLEGFMECLSTHIVPHLFSECVQLEDVMFKNCTILYDLNIVSPKLRHLKIIDCGFEDVFPDTITIVALNLSWLEYNGHQTMRFNVTAPRLLKVFWNASKKKRIPNHPFFEIARSCYIEDLTLIMKPSEIQSYMKVLVQYRNLRQLELRIEGPYDPKMDYFWILDIAMASQHLQKLSLLISDSHFENSQTAGFQRQSREYEKFYHNDLKYVELRGCVGSASVIELARLILRNVNSLEQITFSSCDKVYIGAGRWTKAFNCCWFERNLIHEMLKDEINEHCKLIIM